MDTPNVIVDVTSSIDRQIAALIRHESQMPGFKCPTGETIGARVKKGAAENAAGYGFEYGAVFSRLIARRRRAHDKGPLLSSGAVAARVLNVQRVRLVCAAHGRRLASGPFS